MKGEGKGFREERLAGSLRASFAALLLFPLSGCDGCDSGSHDDFPPSAPAGLAATAVTTERIDLAWTDTSSDEAGFRIERSPDGVAWTEIAVAGAGVTAYTDRGLVPGTLYFYRVRAYNRGGTSPYAGPASATTFPLVWTPHASTGPTARQYHSAIYDAANQRMILFGGLDLDPTGSFLSNEVWALSLPAAGSPDWGSGPLATIGGPPSPRMGHSAIYDAPNQRMIVFGGQDETSALDEVWILTLGPTPTWSQLTLSGPPARLWHSAVHDPAGQRMVVFGGTDNASLFSDLWALTLGGVPGWIQVNPTGVPPAPREEHAAIYDPAGQRMVVFGGNDGGWGGTPFANDAWALGLGGSPAWSLLAPAGAPPSERYGHSAIYDQANARTVVFSGYPDFSTTTILPDLHALGAGWSVLAPGGGPPSARFGHSAIYDAANLKMVIFGGDDGTGTFLSDLWTLGL
jgi:hypothetical protein